MDKLPEMVGTSRTQSRKSRMLPRTSDEQASIILLPGNTYLLTSNSTSLIIFTLSGKKDKNLLVIKSELSMNLSSERISNNELANLTEHIALLLF